MKLIGSVKFKDGSGREVRLYMPDGWVCDEDPDLANVLNAQHPPKTNGLSVMPWGRPEIGQVAHEMNAAGLQVEAVYAEKLKPLPDDVVS